MSIGGDSGRAAQRLHWHDAAHTSFTGKQLYFWFLKFHPLYEEREVGLALERIAADLDIRSYATYELMGAFDVMVRAYLSPSEVSRFEDALDVTLKPLGKTNGYPFRVNEVLRHWVWAKNGKGSGPLRKPAAKDLHECPPLSEIEAIENLTDASPARRELLRRYEKRSLVTRARGFAGIKLVITVSAHDLSQRDLEYAGQRLAKLLDKADGLLTERSLYAAKPGTRDAFLVICRVRYPDFHRIRHELLKPMWEATGNAETRTTTYAVISKDLPCFSEGLTVPPFSRPSADTLLGGHEDQVLEIKGSAFAPLKDWLVDGTPLQEQRSFPNNGVLREIVGLLNSGGGRVVVGVLDEADYKDEPDCLKTVETLPRFEGYRILGLVDPTYQERGWDKWDLKLRQMISSRIDPAPGVLVQTRAEMVGKREICLIDVDCSRSDEDYFLDDTYYGRQGTQVKALKGTQVARHREQVRHRMAQQRIAA